MDNVVAPKNRILVDAQVVATATATGYPAAPTPTAGGIAQDKRDFRGASIHRFRWVGSMSGFTAADLTIQHSVDGEEWSTLKAFTQQTGSDWDVYIDLFDTDPHAMRFIRALVDMTGSPGTSTHTVEVNYDQVGAPGYGMGVPDRLS